MKTFKITLLAALISSPLAAENIDKTWEVGVFADYIKSSTNKENKAIWEQIEAGRGVGIDLQKIINDQWSARFELAKTRYDINNDSNIDYGTRFGLDAIYNVNDSNFYLFTGVKRFNNVRSYNAIDLGAGYSVDISERFALYSEAAIYRDVDYGFTDQGFKLGLKYTFGDEKKSPVMTKVKKSAAKYMPAKVVEQVVKLVDSDNDGVSDKLDRCDNTPSNVKVDSKGCTLYSEKSVAIKLNVAFENNSSQLKASMMNDIQRLADFMKEYQNTNVVIEGHSSAVGSAEYNLMLSQKRADAIKKVLVNKFNIAANRLTATGFGESQLIAQGSSKAANIANRRVVAKIETTVKKVVNKS